ncbi:hypothetical protein, partial [Bradyrhizobium sp.]|uniref:hypothetical protein n=1 Tax=Bradyrhizobium sp. TaxID=376 RepID=UPI00391982AC
LRFARNDVGLAADPNSDIVSVTRHICYNGRNSDIAAKVDAALRKPVAFPEESAEWYPSILAGIRSRISLHNRRTTARSFSTTGDFR